ncbi:hypothetical protein HNQ47_001497 [Catenisphaera adipataccumulans]|uniref:YqeG family HAD IIIA-type phosphatase n=1 Tax=Catenisphaera adipataccumulans TaxID=700500 RepID=A0A7W8FX95_9FIRM|nr:hypothetical protein [Catenisphaera adipataccumulans]
MKLFKPDYYISSYRNLDVRRLKENHIRLLLCDIDNTLAGPHERDADVQVAQFLRRVQQAGIETMICSNSRPSRVRRFVKDLPVDQAYGFSFKPLVYQLKRAMHHAHTDAAHTAIMGDQIFTDILGGNRIGLYTILTNPVSTSDKGVTMLNRLLEKFVFRYLEKKYSFRKGDYDD